MFQSRLHQEMCRLYNRRVRRLTLWTKMGVVMTQNFSRDVYSAAAAHMRFFFHWFRGSVPINVVTRPFLLLCPTCFLCGLGGERFHVILNRCAQTSGFPATTLKSLLWISPRTLKVKDRHEWLGKEASNATEELAPQQGVANVEPAFFSGHYEAGFFVQTSCTTNLFLVVATRNLVHWRSSVGLGGSQIANKR
jgi:hypothetical protein